MWWFIIVRQRWLFLLLGEGLPGELVNLNRSNQTPFVIGVQSECSVDVDSFQLTHQPIVIAFCLCVFGLLLQAAADLFVGWRPFENTSQNTAQIHSGAACKDGQAASFKNAFGCFSRCGNVVPRR